MLLEGSLAFPLTEVMKFVPNPSAAAVFVFHNYTESKFFTRGFKKIELELKNLNT